jgi:hypothetical protein
MSDQRQKKNPKHQIKKYCPKNIEVEADTLHVDKDNYKHVCKPLD